MIAVVLWIQVVALILLVVLLVRNQAVLHASLAFIHTPDFPNAYERLPSYDAMLFHPKYWLLWTTAAWRAWAARQPTGSAS